MLNRQVVVRLGFRCGGRDERQKLIKLLAAGCLELRLFDKFEPRQDSHQTHHEVDGIIGDAVVERSEKPVNV